ncbi:hypothetical protein TL16_g05894 [Triparma laevis f. inornata]|uniref:Uncharacterized protein n=1 Tax=Triparma laevis f. inornata TaxID=1714386 RepID=A0A9W7AKR8_9STRA|nr:hypothetical protein TL16_g05894 [Triparma laevis f. inornata]
MLLATLVAGYTGPRWLRCLSSEVADSDTTTTTDLEDDPTVERIRSGATRGYICPETIRSCSGSSSVGSSSGKSVRCEVTRSEVTMRERNISIRNSA